jgi:hypothetical protein
MRSRLPKFSALPRLSPSCTPYQEVSLICAKIGCCTVTTVAQGDPFSCASIAWKSCTILDDYQASEQVLHDDERSRKVRMATSHQRTARYRLPWSNFMCGVPHWISTSGPLASDSSFARGSMPESQSSMLACASRFFSAYCAVSWPDFRSAHVDAALDPSNSNNKPQANSIARRWG